MVDKLFDKEPPPKRIKTVEVQEDVPDGPGVDFISNEVLKEIVALHKMKNKRGTNFHHVPYSQTIKTFAITLYAYLPKSNR